MTRAELIAMGKKEMYTMCNIPRHLEEPLREAIIKDMLATLPKDAIIHTQQYQGETDTFVIMSLVPR